MRFINEERALVDHKIRKYIDGSPEITIDRYFRFFLDTNTESNTYEFPVEFVVDGRNYKVYEDPTNFEEAKQKCEDNDGRVLPLDLKDKVGSRLHIVKIGERIWELTNRDYDDIDVWLPYKLEEVDNFSAF